MSNLRSELEGVIEAYVACGSSIDTLQDWLADHVQALSDTQDVEAYELSDYVWQLLDDFSCRRLLEKDVRLALWNVIRHGDVATFSLAVTPATYSTGSVVGHSIVEFH